MLQYNPTVSGSLSVTGTITATQGITGSFSGSVAGFPTDVSAFSASLSTRITATESTSSEYVTTSSSLASRVALTEATSSQFVTASGSLAARITTDGTSINTLQSKTGSYATTGSNYFIGNQVITGSVYIANDLVVQGSSSLQNITASAVSIGTNTVILNTNTPILQFGGISVYDSGSTMGRSGSLLWNSINDHWINVNPSGSDEGYNSAMIINGPKNTGSLGNEAGLTEFYIPVSQGEDHITDSIIFQSASVNIGIGTNVPAYKLDVNGTGRFTGALSGSSATFSGNLGLGSTSSAYKLRILTDNTLDNGLYLSGGTGNTNHAVYIENKAGTAELFAVRGDGQIRLNGIGSGNILIGTSIAGGEVLTVYRASGGGVEFQNSTTGTGAGNGTYVGNYQGDAYFWNYENYASILGTNNIERMRITSGGNIIVGYNQTTTSTIGRIFATNHASGNRGATLFYGIDDGSKGGMYVYNVAAAAGAYNSQYITFETHEGGVTAGEIMRITSLGRVGIGTTNPSQKLHIIGGTSITAGNANWFRKTYEINVTTWSDVVSFNPEGSDQYGYGYINITANAYINGGGFGVNTSRWYYSISNGTVNVGVVGTDITTGSPPSIRLTVSSNIIIVQVQSYNTGNTAFTSVFVDAMLGSGYLNGTSWVIS